MRDRLVRLKTVLWCLVGVLASVSVIRFVHGLGAVTNLSDAAPWGLWIGFDVMSGVALAGGGFVLAATVYIFGLERYRPFVRPAILTALLGYAAVAVGLLYDLGLPWRILHPTVHWQYKSVLFEVAMCVILYLTVLSLEFAPVVLEHPRFSRPSFRKLLRGLKKATIPLVITGIVLSTLHQSSLGSLFLIAPHRLHPLWYSHIIDLFFFVSAVGLGLMMVVLESLFSARYLGHKVHSREVAGLGLAASVVLWIYVALRLGDLGMRGVLGTALDGSGKSALFLFEIAMSAVLPATLLLFRRVRRSLRGVGSAAALVVSGMILYRLDVSILAFARPEGFGYFPSWEEFAVSIGIVSAFALVFIFVAEHFRVYDDVGCPRFRSPSFDPAGVHDLVLAVTGPRRYTAAALAGATLALLFLPVTGHQPIRTPTHAARRMPGLVRDRPDAGGRALFLAAVADPDSLRSSGLLLLIDGNRDGDLVLFDHDDHETRLGDANCNVCHHLDLPLDRGTGCSECHRDMYEGTSVFNHEQHVESLGGNDGCGECHEDDDRVKSYETATACAECHRHETAGDPVIEPPQDRWRPAVSYLDAMHELCQTCHSRALEREPDRYSTELDQCRYCHDTDRQDQLRPLIPARTARVEAVAGGGGPAVREGG